MVGVEEETEGVDSISLYFDTRGYITLFVVFSDAIGKHMDVEHTMLHKGKG